MDYIEILTQAGKILWKHKIIYGFFLGVFSIPSILYLVMMGVFVFAVDMSKPERFFSMFSIFDFGNPLASLGFAGGYLIFIGLSFVCAIVSFIGVLKGTSLAESGANPIDFMSLWQASLKYFWRVAAIFFVIGVAVILLMLALMLPTMLVGFLFLPLVCVFIPVSLFGRTAVELVCAAIVNDDLGVQAALEGVWQMIQRYFWPLVLMTILLMVIEFSANMVVTMPIGIVQQVAMQFLFLNPAMQDSSLMFGQMFKWMFVIMIFVMPVMLAVQGLVTTYHLSATALTYLSLTKKVIPAELQAETA